MASLAVLENLMSAHDAVIRSGDFMESADPRAWIRKSTVLLDACIDAGMSHDEPDHHEWATLRVTRFLCEA